MIIKRSGTFNFVCAIGGYNGNNQALGEALIGTGTFIEKDGMFYILTAEHVISATVTATYIILCDSHMIPRKIQLKKKRTTHTLFTHESFE